MTEFEKALIERLDAILDEMKAAREERTACHIEELFKPFIDSFPAHPCLHADSSSECLEQS